MRNKLLIISLFSVFCTNNVISTANFGDGSFTGCGTVFGQLTMENLAEQQIFAFAPLLSQKNTGCGIAFTLTNEITLCDNKKVDLSKDYSKNPTKLYFCTKGGPNIPLCELNYTYTGIVTSTGNPNPVSNTITYTNHCMTPNANKDTMKDYCGNKNLVKEFAVFIKKAKKYLRVIDLSNSKYYDPSNNSNYTAVKEDLPLYLQNGWFNSSDGSIDNCKIPSGILPPIVLTQDWRCKCFLSLPTLTMGDCYALNLADDHRNLNNANGFPCDSIMSETLVTGTPIKMDKRKILYWCCPPIDFEINTDNKATKIDCIAKYAKAGFLQLCQPEDSGCNPCCDNVDINWYGWWSGALGQYNSTNPVGLTNPADSPGLNSLSALIQSESLPWQELWGTIAGSTSTVSSPPVGPTQNANCISPNDFNSGNDGNEIVLNEDWSGMSKCKNHYLQLGDGTMIDISKYTGYLYWITNFKKISEMLGLSSPSYGLSPSGFIGQDFENITESGSNRFLALTEERITLFTNFEIGLWDRRSANYTPPLDIDSFRGTIDIFPDNYNIFSITLPNSQIGSGNKMLNVNWMEIPIVSKASPIVRDNQLVSRFDENCIDFGLIRKFGNMLYIIISKEGEPVCIRKIKIDTQSLVKQKFQLTGRMPTSKVTAADFDFFGNLIIGYVDDNGKVRFSKVNSSGLVSNYGVGIFLGNDIAEITDMKIDKTSAYNTTIFYTTYNQNSGCVAKSTKYNQNLLQFEIQKKILSNVIYKKDTGCDANNNCNANDCDNSNPFEVPEEDIEINGDGNYNDPCNDPCGGPCGDPYNNPCNSGCGTNTFGPWGDSWRNFSNCNFKKPTSIAIFGNYCFVQDNNLLWALRKSNLSVIFSFSLRGTGFSTEITELDMNYRGSQVVISSTGSIFVANKDTLQEFNFSDSPTPPSPCFYLKSETFKKEEINNLISEKSVTATKKGDIVGNSDIGTSDLSNKITALERENKTLKDNFSKINNKLLTLEDQLKNEFSYKNQFMDKKQLIKTIKPKKKTREDL